MVFSFVTISALFLFVLGYFFITIEHHVGVNKSAITLLLGSMLWILVAVEGGPEFVSELTHAGADIFGIVVFLLAAMSLVEVLIHYKFFDVVREMLFRWHLSERKQFVVISVLAFFLSAVIDNLTTTIVMIQIARKFFRGENLVRAAAMVVIAANAGGAFSPIGDVTTIMLWLAGKFQSAEILAGGFLPSLALLGAALLWMSPKVKEDEFDSTVEVRTRMGKSEKGIIGLVFFSFALPVIMNFFGLPPYMGLLFGLGLVWLAVDFAKQLRPRPTHLEASIEECIKRTDIPSIKFFIGILLAVSALNTLGVLELFSNFFYGAHPDTFRIVVGNVLLGIFSAIVDNVPLTAITIEALHTSSSSLWVLLAITVGTGGSLLVIGSAAGVVAMGMVKELTFGTYARIATVPAFLGFAAAVCVWLVQYKVFGM